MFESVGFPVEFTNEGRPRPPTYAGRAVFEGFNYENGKTLSKKRRLRGKTGLRQDREFAGLHDGLSAWIRERRFSVPDGLHGDEGLFSFEGRIRVKEGVSWKGANATSTIYAPTAFFAGRRISLVDANGAAREIDCPAEFDPQTCRLPGFATLDNGEWTLTPDNALLASFYDRRQWNNPSSSIQICPAGGLDWSGKTSDGTEYVWKWTLKHR